MSTTATVEPTTRFTPGAVESLLNYWLTKIDYENEGETKAIPEYNLEESSATALLHLLRDDAADYDATTSAVLYGYDLGIALAIAVLQDPMGNPTPAMRPAINETITYLRNHAKA